MEIKYWFEFRKKWTFEQPKLFKFVAKYIPKKAKVLVPFAGKFRFGNIDGSTFIYNDINIEIKTDFHLNAYKLCWVFPKESFDCIVADPPFTWEQWIRKYKGKRKEKDTLQFYLAMKKWRITANYLLKPFGIYIEIGYNTNGIWKKNAEKIALGICNCGGFIKDILIIVQRKYNNLDKWIEV